MKLNPRVPVLREAIQKIVPMLTDRKVRVTARGSKAYVEYDPKTNLPRLVNVPYMPEDASDTLLDAIQGFLDHEVGHILFTDVDVIKKANKGKVAQVHNFIEDTFVEREMTRKFTGSAFNLANTGRFFLESITTPGLAKEPEKALKYLAVPAVRAWAGQSAFVDFMNDGDKWKLIEKFVQGAGPDMPAMIAACGSSEDCLKVATELNRRLKAAEGKKAEPPKPPKAEEPGKGEKGKGEKGDKDDKSEPEEDPPAADDDTPMGDEDDGKSPGAPPEEDGEDKDDEPGKDEDDEPGEDEDDGKPGSAGDDEGEEGTSSATGEGEDDEDEEKNDELREGKDEEEEGGEFDAEAGKGETATPGSSEGSGERPDENTAEFGAGEEDIPEPGPSLTDEMKDVGDYDAEVASALSKMAVDESEDSEYLIFTTDDDTIEEVPLVGEGAGEVTAMANKVDHMLGPMQKDLERAMAAISATVWSPGHRTGKLHSAALVRGMFGRDDLFRRKEVSRSKDVAVELVVDCSGSMGGEKIEIACQAAYALASVLERIGIQNEVIGFTTRPHTRAIADAMRAESSSLGSASVRYSRTEALYMPIFKGFGERVSPVVKRRFAEIENSVSLRENVDGECIHIASRRLMGRRETRKVMIVLSDGNPSCSGDRTKLHKHLKAVIPMIEKRGVEVVGLGIMDHSVAAYYPKHVIVNSVSDLPTEVMKQLKKFLIR